MTRRFWIGVVLTAPLVFLAMSEMVPGLRGLLSARIRTWLELLLATPVVLWGGWPFFTRAVSSLRNRSPNMFTLIGLGVAVAYVYSLVATLAPGLFPAEFRGPDGTCRRVLRGRERDRHARSPRTGAGAAGARPHRRRYSVALGPCAEDRAPRP